MLDLSFYHHTVPTIVCTTDLQCAHNNISPISLFTARKWVLIAVLTPVGERIPKTYPRKTVAFL